MPVTLPPLADWSRLAEEPDRLVPLPAPPGEPPLFMRFRRIPPGWFWMGSRDHKPFEDPRHCVVVPYGFWLGKFVVTQDEWGVVVRAFKELRELDPDPSNFKGPKRPVDTVSWFDACSWCLALQKWVRAQALGEITRLPLEDEWEYACRAGTETDYFNGDGDEALARVGWYKLNLGFETHPVDEFPTSDGAFHPVGLFGMHGNVWQWCEDVWDPFAYCKRPGFRISQRSWTASLGDPRKSFGEVKESTSTERVLRGGSWFYDACGCRSGFRYWEQAGSRVPFAGFRVLLM